MLLIPIDMPKRCIDCPFYEPKFSRCKLTDNDIPEMLAFTERMKNCPIKKHNTRCVCKECAYYLLTSDSIKSRYRYTFRSGALKQDLKKINRLETTILALPLVMVISVIISLSFPALSKYIWGVLTLIVCCLRLTYEKED